MPRTGYGSSNTNISSRTPVKWVLLLSVVVHVIVLGSLLLLSPVTKLPEPKKHFQAIMLAPASLVSPEEVAPTIVQPKNHVDTDLAQPKTTVKHEIATQPDLQPEKQPSKNELVKTAPAKPVSEKLITEKLSVEKPVKDQPKEVIKEPSNKPTAVKPEVKPEVKVQNIKTQKNDTSDLTMKPVTATSIKPVPLIPSKAKVAKELDKTFEEEAKSLIKPAKQSAKEPVKESAKPTSEKSTTVKTEAIAKPSLSKADARKELSKPLADDSEFDAIKNDLKKSEQDAQQKAEQDRAAKLAEKNALEVGRYKLLISKKIYNKWQNAPNVDVSCILRITVAPDGEVMSVIVKQKSGNNAFDESAIDAVNRSSPLPVSSDPVVFNKLRVITLTMNLKDKK